MNRLCTVLAVLALVLAPGAGCKKKEDPPAGAEAGSAAPVSDAAVAAVGDATVAGGPGLQFKVAAPLVGQVAEVTEVNRVNGTLTAKGQQLPMIQHEEEKRVETVLAVEGDVVTRIEVTYLAKLSHEKMGDQEKKVEGPEKGKTFVVSFADGALAVSDKAGKPVKKEIADELIASFADQVGKVPPMRKVIETKTFRTGETIALSPEEMTFLANSGDGVVGKSMTLTLVDQQGDNAILAFDGALTRQQPGMTMDLTMKGTVKVEVATGRLLEMNVAGDMKGTGAGEFVGTVSGTKVNVFKAAPQAGSK
jgi:hypothetical protein